MLPERATYLTIGMAVALTLGKGAAGVLAGSTALLADAAESASDIASSLAVLGGMHVASRPPDESHPYGHQKAEPVAAKAVSLLVTITGLGVGWYSLRALLQGPQAPGLLAAWVAAVTVVVKEVLYRFLMKESREHRSPALAAAAFMQRSDAFSSVAALFGIIGARMGYPVLDPVMGVVVSVLILRLGISIYVRSVRELMDTAPDQRTMDSIGRTAAGVAGVEHIDEVKARIHGGSGVIVDIKIAVQCRLTVEEGHRIAKRVKEALLREVPAVHDVLVHVNPAEEDRADDG